MTSIPRLTESQWKSHEAVICELFRRDGLPLREVKSFMETNYNFTASDRQWKHRIKRWRLDRNIKNEEMKAIVMKRQYRLLAEPHKPELRFRVRGFEVDPKKIIRWMHEHKIAQDQLYDGYLGTQLPTDISCYAESRQGSPLITGDVATITATSTLPFDTPISANTLSTGSARRYGTDIRIPEVAYEADSISVATKSSEPKCRVETVDMSWAFDTPLQELLEGHRNDQQGHPLGTLTAYLKKEALEQGRVVSARTLAELLQVGSKGKDCVRETYSLSKKSSKSLGAPWDVSIERKSLRNYTQLVWAYAEAEFSTDKLRTWIELRLRIASGNRYYREGSAKFRVVYGPDYCADLFSRAIAQNNIVEIQRILSNGEATVFSLDEHLQYPISISARMGNVGLTQLLLEHGSPRCVALRYVLGVLTIRSPSSQSS
ncbi:hypothetical protein C7974DRAFT_66417 [Boeremia exigua]|uniref:uncharacterized protein n=1 Tax=Boeremia exigua TaxID=749465 RepID=UPI001E8DF6B6|nr:uncharacterized protein C7974DRAFT_66417 [Boeremia exigua]KAH6613894.1 hypothetical protein C7974DRAFT_66417 [Boeremia exigua]